MSRANYSISITVINFLLALLPGYLSVSSYIFLSLCLITKYKWAPVIFLNLCFLVLGNEDLFTGLSSFGNLKYLIIFIFIIQSIFYFPRSFINNNHFVYLVLLFFVIFTHSLFFSFFPLYSIIKIGFWFSFVMCFLIFFYKFNVDDKIKIFSSSYFVLLLVVIFSLILNFFPSIGYSLNGEGLQGITNQPQVFGAISGLFSLASLILFFKKNKYLLLFCFLMGVFGVYLSQSRTAFLALCISLFFLLIQVFWDKISLSKIKVFSKNSLKISISFLFIFPFFILFNFEYFIDFLNKRGEGGVTSVGESSRSFFIGRMLNNIDTYGLTGIGLGIPSDFNFSDMSYLPFIDLPISLPVEKGVFYIANIEELGFLFGGLVFLILFIMFKKRFIVNIYASIIVFIFSTNLAENTFFSVGGLGMLFWVFACMAMVYLRRESLIK
ncbi:oligosaccharide repeat unit polymerase [Acinetobacter sp. ANC 4282]|uniref:O-antigen polymerase n=1 Tax=Acinetobacter terrae TaxID=2731247 RepID=UPI00148FFC4A|nr:O-antigen polymerase [Acinetobacter terrae]NNH16645.1 oligosaccharide repeat unit polymerase [Acinetobacter terrae]